MDIISLLLFAVGLISSLLGLTIIARDHRSLINRSFLLFSLLVTLWIVSNALFRVASRDYILPVALSSYVTAYLLSASFLYFTNTLRKRRASLLVKTLIAYSIPAAVLSGVPNVIATGVNEQKEIITTGLASIYGLGLSANLLIGVWNIISFYRYANNGRERNQASLMLLGFAGSVLGGVFFNIVLPIGFENYQYVYLGPATAIFFVVSIAYAILRHRLFDIRLIVARSIAYILSFVFVGLAGAASLVTVTSVLFDTDFTTAEISLFTLVILVFSALFQPFKRFFDNLTGKLFFRDVYDSQRVLDELSSMLATEIELKTIVYKSSQLLKDSLNPSYLRFVVFKDGESYIDQGGKDKHSRTVIRPEVDGFPGVLIMREDASEKEKEFLDLYDADILLKLRANEETVGIVLLGPKQSGTVYSRQDIDLLTIGEKELAIAIQNARYLEQIQEFNIKLQKEVDQATAELRANNEKLKALDEAKDEFVSMASHQLRTPLTSVKGYISMVIEGDAGKLKPEQQRLLEEAFGSSQRMVYLIADLLNVSRLKTGKFIIEPREIHLPDVVEQEVQQLKPTADSRKLTLRFEKPRRFPKIWLDETKIRQVIMNFIDNAIYYTPAGGQIEITLTAKRDTIEFRVKDTGIGVPKDEQPKLFTKFFRAGNARKARPDGTGLGLYMAQRVVSAQGGTIISESEEGKGSTFGFAFPLKKIREKPNKPVRLKSERHRSESTG